MIDTKAARDLTSNVIDDGTIGDEKKTVRLLGLVSDAMCDIIEELRLIREAGERETIPPPCPECQGIHTHLPRCRHFDPHYRGARDIPEVMEVTAERSRMMAERRFGPDRRETVEGESAFEMSRREGQRAGNVGMMSNRRVASNRRKSNG